jgi:hypothetical protein
MLSLLMIIISYLDKLTLGAALPADELASAINDTYFLEVGAGVRLI